MALFTNSADNSEPAPRKVLKNCDLGCGKLGDSIRQNCG